MIDHPRYVHTIPTTTCNMAKYKVDFNDFLFDSILPLAQFGSGNYLAAVELL